MSDQRISRRRALFTGTVATLGAAAAMTISSARAQQKIGQADAQYRGAPNGNQRCSGCFNFQAPNACKFVQGDINPNGWCQLFSPKEPS